MQLLCVLSKLIYSLDDYCRHLVAPLLSLSLYVFLGWRGCCQSQQTLSNQYQASHLSQEYPAIPTPKELNIEWSLVRVRVTGNPTQAASSETLLSEPGNQFSTLLLSLVLCRLTLFPSECFSLIKLFCVLLSESNVITVNF